MADKSNDPAAIWQTMIGEMEKGFNSFANQAMASPEFSKVVNQVGGVTAGAQKQLGDLMEKYLVSMNLRSEEHTSELQSHSDLHSFPTRRSSDLVARIFQGRQSGRRGYSGRAKAARRSHGEIPRQHEP